MSKKVNRRPSDIDGAKKNGEAAAKKYFAQHNANGYFDDLVKYSSFGAQAKYMDNSYNHWECQAHDKSAHAKYEQLHAEALANDAEYLKNWEEFRFRMKVKAIVDFEIWNKYSVDEFYPLPMSRYL